MNYITRGKSSPQGKPRVYFAAHPEDFEIYFNEITSQILKYQNCAIFYDSEDAEPPDDYALNFMQLVVIPVTGRFINSPSYARDKVLRYATEHHIPVLPVIEEHGIAAAFNKLSGNLHFLDPHSTDDTGISYEEKLEKFLNAVLIGDEAAERIRAAFDAYVFLSYRKKDRYYAQELMKLIHSNADFRNIAIWYDEFLVPGENFNDAIKAAFEKSELFTLVVTPNLVNEQNYVMETEYPMAIEAGINILPVEMSATERSELEKAYPNIPECETPADAVHLNERLSELLASVAKNENNNNPQHNFDIGLAYLGGIDVEKNPEFAVKLITGAADAGLPEAIKKLSDMYRYGDAVERNLDYAAVWLEKYVNCLYDNYQMNKNPDNALIVLNEMSDLYLIYYKEMYDIDKAYDIAMKMQEFAVKTQTEIPKKYMVIRFWPISLQCLAKCCKEQGDFEHALEYAQLAFAFIEKNIDHVYEANTILLAKSDYRNIALDISEIYRGKYDYENQRKYVELSRKFNNELQGSIVESDPATVAMNLKTEADSLATSGEIEMALKKYIQAEEIFDSLYAETQDIQYLMMKCNCCFEHARAYMYMGAYAESKKISEGYINDLLYIEKDGYDYHIGRAITEAYEQIAASRIRLKQYEGMQDLLSAYLAYAGKAMDNFDDRETRKDFARCCTRISEYYFAVGMIDEAINKQQIARKIYCIHYDEIEQYSGVEAYTILDLAECDNLLAEYCYAAGYKVNAAEYYEESYSVLSNVDVLNDYFYKIASAAFLGAGKCEEDMNNIDKAITHYRRAANYYINVYERHNSMYALKDCIDTLITIAEIGTRNDRYDLAAEYYGIAINAADREKNDPIMNHLKACCLWNLSNIINGEQAMSYKGAAIEIWQMLVKQYPDTEVFRDHLRNALNSLC